MTLALHFAPNEDIAEQLIPHIADMTSDASHDHSHLLRVWLNVRRICAHEGGDQTILPAATLLHDCVDVAKDSALRSSASRMAADKAIGILTGLNWSPDQITQVAHAIHAHSFSANITPDTVEAKILQDADRLDAIGYVGVARCFYVSGRLDRALYDPSDPAAARRPLDDTAYALAHFTTKLLRLAGSFQTETGRLLARERHETVQSFLNGMLAEIAPT